MVRTCREKDRARCSDENIEVSGHWMIVSEVDHRTNPLQLPTVVSNHRDLTFLEDLGQSLGRGRLPRSLVTLMEEE